MALVMNGYLKKKVNLEKVLKILIVHDLCEIYAGDHWAWKPAKQKVDKHDKEKNGMLKLLKLLPKTSYRNL